MRLSARDWQNYIEKLSRINAAAADQMQAYIDKRGMDNTDELLEYAHALATKYGEASGTLACEMYDAVAGASGKSLPAAEMAQTATFDETAKAVLGTIINPHNTVASTVGRLVKQVAADTTLKNAERDGAKFAWIPHGDSCAFCITLASRGWQYMSAKLLKRGHAEHIHANCDCEFAISFDKNPQVEGYDPDYYLRIYRNAKGATSKDKIKYIRSQMALRKPDITDNSSEWAGEKLKKALGLEFESFSKLVNASGNKKLYDKYSEVAEYHLDGKGYFQPGTNSVHFGYTKRVGKNKYNTLAHENGHMFDKQLGRIASLHYTEADLINERCKVGTGAFTTIKIYPSSSDEFLTALRVDMKNLRPKLADKSLQREILATEEMRNATAGIQDALDGFYSTQDKRILPWGHGDRYYNREYNRRIAALGNEKKLKAAYSDLGFDASNQAKTKRLSRVYEAASEAWANISSAVTCGGKELECIQKYMPESHRIYMKIIEEII